MTTAADDSADEIAFEAFLAGRAVPAEADGSSPAVVTFAGADGMLGTADDALTGDLTGTGTPWTVTDGGRRRPRRPRQRRSPDVVVREQ